MSKNYCLYMMSNYSNTVLYLGMTNNLLRRVCEHKAKLNQGFSAKYNCDKLVYFETGKYVEDVIAREKQIKNWKRAWKNELIETMNPNWDDLSESIGITSELVSQIAAMNCDASFLGSDGLDISLEAEMDGEIAGQARNDTTNKSRNDTTNRGCNDTANRGCNDTGGGGYDTSNKARSDASSTPNVTGGTSDDTGIKGWISGGMNA